MDDTRATDQMPQTIGRYQIQESVGYGAMGAVYKAFDPLIKRTLAIKTIRLDIPRQSPQYKSFIERFYHEARISGTLSHPNIVTLFDIGEEGGLPYLAMEFVEGETIASILDRGVKFKPERVIALVSQIASAIDYAHGKGVIHRDIKPSNLILYDGDKVKVTDFGIAKLVDTEMTQSGTLLGTPSYMSPEQAMGEKLDGRSDIFSLGVCAFEMLSGEQPFPGSNVTAILYKLVHADPVEPKSLEMNGLVPQKWHEVFGRVLAKKPDDRYQSATEFVQDLEYCLGAWFGSAMGEETLVERAPVMAAPPLAADDTPPPKSTPAPVPPPAMPPAVRQAAAKTQPPVPIGQKPDPQSPKTVSVRPLSAGEIAAAAGRAPAGAADDSATVVLRAQPAAPAANDDAQTVMLKAAPAVPAPATDEARTVMLKAAPAPPPPADENTVMLKAAPAPTAPGEDKTVVLKAPAQPAPPPRAMTPRPAAPTPAPAPPRPPAPEPPAGPTVVMAAADVTRQKPAAATSTPRPPAAPKPAPPAPPPPRASTPRAVRVPEPAPVAEPPATRKGPPLAAILGGVGLLLVLALIGAGIFVYKRFAGPVPQEVQAPAPPVTTAPRPRPRQAAPVAVATGHLHVESQPPGATVSIDGRSYGVTPLDVPDVPFGAHEVKVDLKGYVASTETILVSADAASPSMSVALSRTAPATGAAEVVSEPAGGIVRIDGTPVGQTPFTDPKMKAGSHRVEVLKDGYEPWSGTVAVQPGKRARIDARLRAVAVAAPPPTPAPDVVDVNRIYVNSPTEVDTPARKLSGPSAAYPSDRAARLKSGSSVSVRLGFVVTETGEVTDVRVVESAGRLVDDAVLSAVRKWKYSPAIKRGTPVKVRVDFRQTFRAS